MDSADVSSFYYSIKGSHGAFNLYQAVVFKYRIGQDSDVHDCNTLEHIYKPLKIKSRIILFTR